MASPLNEQPQPKKRGRKPLINDPQIRERLAHAFSVGCPITIACDYAGIAEGTFHKWCAQNDDFKAWATHARNEATVYSLEMVRRAAPEDWRAAAELLRLTRPQTFGKNAAITLQGAPDGAPLRFKLEMSDRAAPDAESESDTAEPA
jgi:hypothetical protein